MLNRSASLAMSTCILKTLPGKLDSGVMGPLQFAIFYLKVVIFLTYETNTFMLIQSHNYLMMYLSIMYSYS